MFSRRIGIAVIAVFLLGLGSAFAGEKIKAKGVITLRDGNNLTVKTAGGPLTVVVTGDTKVQQPLGVGLRKKDVSPDLLIPGLRLSFEGEGGAPNQVIASTITFDSDDLALAEVIQAGLNPTAEQQARNIQAIAANKVAITQNRASIAAILSQVEANKERIAANQAQIDEVASSTAKRFSELGESITLVAAVVYFAPGDYTLALEDQAALAILASQATKKSGYVISVKGFTDSTGGADENQVLSRRRAQAVIAFLLQDCGIPANHIAAPGAMGETNPAATNETVKGRAENRRAEVKLLVNKGIVGAGM